MTAAECSTISVADDVPFIFDIIGRTLMAAWHHVCVVNSGRLVDISEEAISDCERRCAQYKEKKG